MPLTPNRICRSQVLWEPLTVSFQPLDPWLHRQDRSVRSCHSNREPPLSCETLEAKIETDEKAVVVLKKKGSVAVKF